VELQRQGYWQPMSFYGPPREQLGTIVSGLKQVEAVYEANGLTTFMQDNMVALMRNQYFAGDQKFVTAVLSNAHDDADSAKIWRLHTCCWAARSALAVDGDYVECGTYKGFYASAMTPANMPGNRTTTVPVSTGPSSLCHNCRYNGSLIIRKPSSTASTAGGSHSHAHVGRSVGRSVGGTVDRPVSLVRMGTLF